MNGCLRIPRINVSRVLCSRIFDLVSGSRVTNFVLRIKLLFDWALTKLCSKNLGDVFHQHLAVTLDGLANVVYGISAAMNRPNFDQFYNIQPRGSMLWSLFAEISVNFRQWFIVLIDNQNLTWSCHVTVKSEAIACARRYRPSRWLTGWWTRKE
jgi:hypothetical protein